MTAIADTIDFSSLDQPVTNDDLKQYVQPRPKNYVDPLKIVKIAAICFGIMGLLPAMIIFFAFGPQNASLPEVTSGVVLMPFIIMALVLLPYFFVARRRKEYALLARFARQNSLAFEYQSTYQRHSGMIFTVGDTPTTNAAYQFANGVEIGNHSYSTGSGRSRRTHQWGYVGIKMQQYMPHMILDAKQNNFMRFSNLPQLVSSDQHLSLEGDFDNYFTLYAPKQYGSDALYIFTPDVMQALIDNAYDFDIEVIDNMVFLYTSQPFKMDDQHALRETLGLSEIIIAEIGKQNSRYSDHRVGETMPVNSIATQGQRLRHRRNWFGIIIFIFLFIFYAYTFSAQWR